MVSGMSKHGFAIRLVLHASVQILREHSGSGPHGLHAGLRVPPERAVRLQIPLARSIHVPRWNQGLEGHRVSCSWISKRLSYFYTLKIIRVTKSELSNIISTFRYTLYRYTNDCNIHLMVNDDATKYVIVNNVKTSFLIKSFLLFIALKYNSHRFQQSITPER